MSTFALIAAFAVAVFLVAEARGWRRAAGVAKGAASSAFVAAALASHATATLYGRLLLVALALSWLGDLLLLSDEERPFLAGLGAFLAAHLAFAAAFLCWGVDIGALGVALLALAPAALLIARWLLPHVGARMRRPVIAYMVALCAMVAMAAGAAWSATPARLLLAAAIAFLLSDLAVARDRFVAPGIANKLWGLPLYYAAQLAFAASAATAAVAGGAPR